ncbi:MAG: hypothetical protein S4CHLAM7_09150 [Chlamydiae bacterium]|nr:hypothetical protein [Chlamydiota bacterium]
MYSEEHLMDDIKVDTQELEVPETTYVRDIENRVFQAIVLQVLTRVEHINLLEGNLIDAILNRGNVERIKGIFVEQDSKSPTIKIKVEVNVHYGISIPEKAKEIQQCVAEEVNKLTGLHVSCVHVIFKSMYIDEPHEIQEEVNDLNKEEFGLEADAKP